MNMARILLIPIILSAMRAPLVDALDNQSAIQDQKVLLLSSEPHFDDNLDKSNKTVKNASNVNDANSQTILSILRQASSRSRTSNSKIHDDESKTKNVKQARKHKTIFVDYSLIPHTLHYPKTSTYEVDHNDNLEAVTKERSFAEQSKKYQESNVFYIRLPPTPYIFMPGLGYISRPPMYPTASLQLPQLPHLEQAHLQVTTPRPPHVRPPVRPEPIYQQTVNPFIKLPIDFVSNGKPISVYQWQKKPGKRPADSPITNLDNLSADFVSNGKPTSIYQWQANSKPVKKPDDSFNRLDKGPYIFNGKLTNLYLLGSDRLSSMQQSLRYPDYQDDYRDAYY